MKTIGLLIPFLAGIGLWACTEGEEILKEKIESDQSRELFCRQSQIGAYRGETALWTFDPTTQQLAMCEGANNDRFYIESDDEQQTVCFSLPTSVKSAETGTNVQIHLSCRNVAELQPGPFPLEVVQRDTEGEFPKVWLWSESERIGFIIYTRL